MRGHALLAVLAVWGIAGCGAPGRVPVPRHPAVAPHLASAPVRLGDDRFRLLSGSPAFDVMTGLIRAAQRSVHVEMYELQRQDLLDALSDAQSRGVPVTVVVDPTGAGTAASAASLRSHGVEVVEYPVRRLMIDHVKLLVVDGAEAVVGGINWGDGSAANHDFDGDVIGPAVAALDAVFARDLVTSGRAVPVPVTPSDPAVLVASTLPDEGIRPLALRLVDTAQRTLDLQLFVLTDVGVVHAVERARARGVVVRVLLDPGQRPNDAAFTELEAAGVPVRRYRSSGEKLHAKAAVADGVNVLFGSANWTTSGFTHNHELDIELPHAPQVAADMTAVMDADWQDSAPADAG